VNTANVAISLALKIAIAGRFALDRFLIQVFSKFRTIILGVN
jgi:hypothetical protein